jgi:hypothetical protein
MRLSPVAAAFKKEGIEEIPDLLTIKEASVWASKFLEKKIDVSNISYLIQYGKIKKYGDNGSALIKLSDLKKYYDSFNGKRELNWKSRLGNDLNWHLSFDNLREKDTTKHVHRLHPYKGKFIPQLVEYFLDAKTDEFKKNVYFEKDDIILDPFCGSGTTLVQSNELGMHAIGIDVSSLDPLISNAKVNEYDLALLNRTANKITERLIDYTAGSNTAKFESKLAEELSVFNDRYFPSPEFKYKLENREIDESGYGSLKEKEFLHIYNKLTSEYGIELFQKRIGNEVSVSRFLDKWYLPNIRSEIDFVFELIKKIPDKKIRSIIAIILSRTIRSCRATTHSDLATLIRPVATAYYCTKHKKICKPLFSIISWWLRYSNDTVVRLNQFSKIKTNTFQTCLTGDSRTMDVLQALEKSKPELAGLTRNKRIAGIFSSPPYVGLIDYHEQHAYAYDLFGFPRKDDFEIGPLSKGTGREARAAYVEGVAGVLNNCKKYLADDYNVFLVANDKYNLYGEIAEKAGMRIISRFKRPVLNRTEKDKGAYAEIIFHMKEG